MLQDGETVENALRRFKRKVLQENIIGEVKRHSFYLKPGQKLRVKQALARKRNRKKARREPEEGKENGVAARETRCGSGALQKDQPWGSGGDDRRSCQTFR
jgi:small subunit ribosomal protein S21